MKHHPTNYLLYYIIIIDFIHAFLISFLTRKIAWDKSEITYTKDYWYNFSWALFLPPVVWAFTLFQCIKNVKQGNNFFASSKSYSNRKSDIQLQKQLDKKGLKFFFRRLVLSLYK